MLSPLEAEKRSNDTLRLKIRRMEKLLKEADAENAQLKAKLKRRAHPEHKMRKTSIEAFRGMRLSGAESERLLKVYDVLVRSDKPLTDWEITEALGWTKRNHVSPSRNKLVKNRMVEECEARKCTSELGTKIKCITWRAVER